MTPWAEEKYLSILEKTKIKNIRPWAYIGGYEESFIEGQSFQLMLNVLERIPGKKATIFKIMVKISALF